MDRKLPAVTYRPFSKPGLVARLLICTALIACGPQGPLGVIPGGPLAGDVVAQSVANWHFTDDDVTVAIETHGEWIDHSVTVLAMTDGPHLYVPSREGFRKSWVKNIERDLEILKFEVGEFICEGERVVVTGSETSRVLSTGRSYTMAWVHIFRIQNGRIAEFREYNDTAAMRAAFLES